MSHLILHTTHTLGTSIVLVHALVHHVWLAIITSHKVVVLVSVVVVIVVEGTSLASRRLVVPRIIASAHSLLIAVSSSIHTSSPVTLIGEHLLVTHLMSPILCIVVRTAMTAAMATAGHVAWESLLVAIHSMLLHSIT